MTQRLLPAAGTYAELGFGASTSHVHLDSNIRSLVEGPDGNLINVTTVADSGLGDGVTFEVDGYDITCHFEDGVSTVADFEAALAADAAVSALIEVDSSGTAAAVLAASDDESTDFLSGGGAASVAAPTVGDDTVGVEIIPCDALQVYVRSVAGSGTMTATVTLWGYHEEKADWYLVKKLNGGSAIPETTSDAIHYAEWVGLGRFSRLYAQLATAGTGTEVEVFIDRLRRLTRL